MGLPSDFPFFAGDNEDKGEKPSTWLKHLKQEWGVSKSDTDKIHEFESSLNVDSPAEEWWTTELDAKQKTTWKDVHKAFIARWPLVKAYITTPAMK
jgi:hypothetical protein